MNYRKYYTELGRLLYAIAYADGKVQNAEAREIRRIVSDELLNIDESTDSYASDAAFSTEFEFETLDEWEIPAQDAFEVFKNYIRDEKDLPPFLKKVAYRSALRVAESFRGVNKDEELLLSELKETLRA